MSPDLVPMSREKDEKLRDIFESHTTGDEALWKMVEWAQSSYKYFPKSCRTINLQVTLGYANPSVDPDINAVLSRRSFIGDINNPDDVEASIDIEQNQPDFDGNLDGFKHFVQLIDDEEFTQTIEITNNGHRRAKNVKFQIDVSNSQFSRLTSLEIASDSDVQSGVNGLGHITIDGNNQTATIRVHNIHPGQTLKLNAISTIDQQAFNENPEDDIDVRNLNFSLVDEPGVVDYGSGDATGLAYLDPGGFSKVDGILEGSGFEFGALADSTLSVNLYGQEVFQEAETLRGYAEYSGIDTTPNNEGSLEREKTFFFFEFAGDVDASINVRPGGTRSDELSLNDELTLLWLNRPDLDEAVNEYIAETDDIEAYNQLLDLIDAGIAEEVFSTTELKGQIAQFIRSGLNGQGAFTQTAIGGELVNGDSSPFEILTFDRASGATFGDFVEDNATDPNILYRIDILETSALDDLRFDNFTGDNVALVVIPPGADALRITNGNGNDLLDLSNTLIATSTGVNPTTGNLIPGEQTGIDVLSQEGDDTIVGTSGDDTIDGGKGDDSLSGGQGGDDFLTGGGDADRFAISAGEGTNTITDFGGVGRGANPPQAIIDEVDTLEFFGEGLIAENLLLTQNGPDLELTFVEVENTQVILQNFALENLDNLPQGIGNILFDGQQSIEDSFDVFNAESDRSRIFNRNTVTFLNELDNDISGLDDSDDVINGQGGDDTLSGLSGDDLLRGGAGDDSLTGDRGNDRFSFSTSRAFDPTDVGIDTLTDFTPSEDAIVLSKTTFTSLTSAAGGPLDEAEFAVVDSNAEIAESSALIVYSLETGNLFYNQNGVDPDLGTGAQFAILSGEPANLSAGDFQIIA
ncbi:MAG: calcium-binding protein [Xenococcaceae cyanobacterium MO_188.B32]|nr:calcium-binding protein [Xenococcaceae cyanobacterium MO_188.B32]